MFIDYTHTHNTNLTWFSETVRGKLVHGAEIRTELLPLFRVAKSVDHPGTHAAEWQEQTEGVTWPRGTVLVTRFPAISI